MPHLASVTILSFATIWNAAVTINLPFQSSFSLYMSTYPAWWIPTRQHRGSGAHPTGFNTISPCSSLSMPPQKAEVQLPQTCVRQFSTLVNAPAGQLDCCTAGTEQLKHPAEPTQRQTAYTATCAAVIAPSCICSLSHIWRWDICCFGTNILPDLHSLHQQFLVITRVPICSKYKAKPLSITHCILLQNEPQTTSMYSDSSGDVWKAWGCGIQTVYLIPSAFPKWILVTRLNALKQNFSPWQNEWNQNIQRITPKPEFQYLSSTQNYSKYFQNQCFHKCPYGDLQTTLQFSQKEQCNVCLSIQQHFSDCALVGASPSPKGWTVFPEVPTWPKFTAACWADVVNIITVRYSASFSRVLITLGNPEWGRRKE